MSRFTAMLTGLLLAAATATGKYITYDMVAGQPYKVNQKGPAAIPPERSLPCDEMSTGKLR